LQAARNALDASRYADAAAAFGAALEGNQRAEARLGLAEVALITGRYDEVSTYTKGAGSAPGVRERGAILEAEALQRQGKLDEAEAVLRRVAPRAKDKKASREVCRAELLLGEILLERGQNAEGEAVLMPIIEDYNNKRISEKDGLGLAIVGRAAHLLQSPQDANDAFNEAEQAGAADVQTLLWRAELFLDKFDPENPQDPARQVTSEAVEKAPNHPEANVWMAQVYLADSLDFDRAERLARQALAVNPKLSSAYFVLAGIALRDMEIELAEQRIQEGLKYNPRDLALLSLRAAVRYLADDPTGFESAKKRVLSLSPHYSRMYDTIGEYAEWEHRYEDIIDMMREALRVDPDDARARAQLGLNLIRSGKEADGLSALRDAFRADPSNVRVLNTLNLYEKDVAQSYETVQHPHFNIRYHKEERQILERYVPQMLGRAWGKMLKYYRFVPQNPVGIELYAERRQFSVRTSGLRETAIQGVCFGKTLAAMSLKQESFNLGMTLWHELSHVFHIQLSKNRVPRWFTEGLAEYETLAERREWKREQDPDLFEALRSQRLPQVAHMSQAFTRAEELSDVATAYYASSQIVTMMVERYGRPKMVKMLELWGKGKRTDPVVLEALGVASSELDAQFRQYLEGVLKRYTQQFMPLRRTGPLEAAEQRARANPNDARAQTIYALALRRARPENQGRRAAVRRALDRALKLDPKLPDARFLVARVQLEEKQPAKAQATLEKMVADGIDGYDVEMSLAEAKSVQKQAFRAALETAHRFDPTQVEALRALAELAKREGRGDDELAALRELSLLDEHNAETYERLLALLVEREKYDEALQVGEAAIYADMRGLESHMLYAQALHKKGQRVKALYELESASLCPGKPEQLAEVQVRLAELYLAAGQRAKAKQYADRARELNPTHPRAGQLP
jgi:tetratricopeptide (TPR) repeat protein